MKHSPFIALIVMLLTAVAAAGQQKLPSTPSGTNNQNDVSVEPPSPESVTMAEAITKISAWRVSDILGSRYSVPVDTLMEDYCQSVAIPSLQFGYASAITGNYGAEGIDMLYFNRPRTDAFMFRDALRPYLPSIENTTFYNNRVPMTIVSYNTGGGREQAQDRLRGTFNGNINSKAQIGAWIDYLYSKGSYDKQADKHFNWGANGSYLGDRYQVMAIYNQFNSLNKENGGIQDDLYILDPAEIQGGSTSVATKNIPVNLQNAHSRVRGRQAWMNNKYRLGFYRENEDSTRTFVPVTEFFWTFSYDQATHIFLDKGKEDSDFWNDTYFTEATTDDITRYRSISNTVGVSLLEGFNKYAKAGLSAYVQHQWSRYTQTPADTIEGVHTGIAPRHTENTLYLGARLSKEQGKLIRYHADGRVGIGGSKAGEVDVNGEAELRVRIRRDTATVRAYAQFSNLAPSYFQKQFVSNHFIWDNDFGMTRRLRFGGILTIPNTRTSISAGMENVQNLIYYGADSRPVQHSGNIQVFSASLRQDFKFGILNWQNSVTYQKSGNSEALPLPQVSLFTNLFLRFHIATLQVQFGVDCNYMTSYYALGYQPATMSFYNQREVKVGNYPVCDAYLNMKLSKVRFYLLFSHFNQGLFGGSNYFSTAHNPLNPRRLLFGLSIDFAN